MATIKTTLPYHKDWQIYQGQTWSAYIIRKDASGDPISLSGWTAAMQLRKKRGGDLLIELTETSGISIDGSAGQVTFSLTAAQTAAIKVQHAEYDLFLTNPGGDETVCILEGTITIRQRATIH